MWVGGGGRGGGLYVCVEVRGGGGGGREQVCFRFMVRGTGLGRDRTGRG